LKRAAKGFLILLAVLGVLIGGSLWFLNATLGSGMCHTTIYQQAVAQDGTVARVQMTDCGATTGFSRVVMLTQRGMWKRDCRALALNGQPKVQVVWAGSDIRVRHDALSSDVIAQDGSCFGHAIQVSQER
jgi:hypothetical protein